MAILKEGYDFGGWATKANLLCSDGRVIMPDAFAHNDGQRVPLVWNHQHSDPDHILGYADLENRPEGVYAHCKFNETDTGNVAKQLVQHGDIVSLSIYANGLTEKKSHVTHGNIREVSLVLAGANPGAGIDSVTLSHGEDSDDEGIVYSDTDLDLAAEAVCSNNGSEMSHSADKTSDDETIADVLNTLTEKQMDAVYALIAKAMDGDASTSEYDDEEDDNMSHSDSGKETIGDILETLSEKQLDCVYALIGAVLEETKSSETSEENDEEGDTDMKHNVFDTDVQKENQVLSHSDITAIISDAKRTGSLRDAAIAHNAGEITHAATDDDGKSVTYGIANVDYLFPDARNITREPLFIKRDTGWVTVVMGAVKHSPFSRIKSIFADITADDARAKGYLKGNKKVEEVFTLLKRSTTPTTIYKKQKMDRDDVVDITDFDVVSWIKSEMRVMLDEEIARAILVGDGRSSASDDKINESNIRPIWKDDSLYTIKATIQLGASETETTKGKKFIKAVLKARKNYKGSGNPILLTTEDVLTDLLLIEDTNGRNIYESVDKLATALRVSKIVTSPVLENQTRAGVELVDGDTKTRTLMGIIVNLSDYTVGADKGGAVNLFEDFDIDFNQQKYLIEPRCSGALTKPYSAIAIESIEESAG